MSAVKFIAIGLSITAVGAAVLLLDAGSPRASQEHRPAAPPSVSSRATAGAPTASRREHGQAQELAELRHEVRRLADDREGSASAEPTQLPVLEPEPAPQPAATPDEAAEHVALVSEVLETRLDDEAFDSTASDHASEHIATTLAQAELGGRLLDLDCGQTLCRGRLEFDDVAQRDARLQNVGGLMPWEADGFFRTDPDDDLRVAVYFTREGQALPTLDDAS